MEIGSVGAFEVVGDVSFDFEETSEWQGRAVEKSDESEKNISSIKKIE